MISGDWLVAIDDLMVLAFEVAFDLASAIFFERTYLWVGGAVVTSKEPKKVKSLRKTPIS